MDTYLHSLSLKLKENVLEVANIQNMTSAYCRLLSVDIALKTGKRISITTLKRVYGYAKSHFMLSQFTLNVMAEYCGYLGWDHYVQEKEHQYSTAAHWEDLTFLCMEITCRNLLTNKNASGIPYHMTIERKALARHLNGFAASKKIATFLCAHKGMGKTIGLTHWLEHQLAEKNNNAEHDIFLYINNLPLYLSAEFNFNWRIWLADLLHLQSPNSLDRLFKEFNNNMQGRFFLIIEDLNNDMIAKKRFDFVFKQIADMIKQLASYNWVKIIVTLLPPTWQKYCRHIASLNLEKKEYPSAFYLPEFTSNELHTLAANVNGRTEKMNKYTLSHYSLISQPVYAQNFYYLKGRRLPLNELSQGDIYTISFFSLRKFLVKGQSMENQYVLCQLALHLHFLDDFAFVYRMDVLSVLRGYSKAYHHLLSTGIIYECHQDVRNPLLSQIAFKSCCIAAYFITLKTLQNHQLDFDRCFAACYDSREYPKSIKAYVLHWLMILYIESNAVLRACLGEEVRA